ncbi:MAG: hypothetical protein EOO65_05500 [Methanosarcinales archaeon]|nr:MAG: hypothetical protein EOO65_05500 [Methanosarcinales archaeon]
MRLPFPVQRHCARACAPLASCCVVRLGACTLVRAQRAAPNIVLVMGQPVPPGAYSMQPPMAGPASMYPPPNQAYAHGGK